MLAPGRHPGDGNNRPKYRDNAKDRRYEMGVLTQDLDHATPPDSKWQATTGMRVVRFSIASIESGGKDFPRPA
jgi:hypothetical protein